MSFIYTASIYSIRFGMVGTEKLHKVDNLPGNNSAYLLFKQYLEFYKTDMAVDVPTEKCLRVKHLEELDGNILYSIIESGDYGKETPIVDVETKVETSLKKTQAALLPFGLMAHFEENSDRGIIIFQRISGNGIKTIFTDEIARYYKNKCGAIKIDISPLTDEGKIDILFSRGVKRLRLIRPKVAQDICDNLADQATISDVGTIEVVINAKRTRTVKLQEWIKDFITGKRKITKGVEISGVTYDNLKIEFMTEGGQRKSLNVAKVEDFSMPVDINSVDKGMDGWPNKESLKEKLLGVLAYGKTIVPPVKKNSEV